MFCPQCGSTQSDDLKFCKACGANLGNVRDALHSGKVPGKFDWSKTWVAEMLQSSEQAMLQEKERERLKGITPESKRRMEIKAGVIVSSVGLGVMIFLYIFMQGIVLRPDIKPGDAEILLRVWIAGVIPFLVGIALMFNGLIVSKMFSGSEKRKELERQQARTTAELTGQPSETYLPPADTSQLFKAGFSVTDETTQHLKEAVERERKSP
jgi:hypothetical protein